MISDVKEILGIITAGGGIIWGGWKYGAKPLIAKNKKAKAEWIGKITEIRDELKFNGGSSLKDAVYHVKNKVDKIEVRLDVIEGNSRLSMTLQDIAFWESDHTGKCTYASPGLCKIMGRSESEIINNNWTAWIHPEDKDKVIHAWAISVNEKSAFDEIYRYKKSDGFWVKVWGVAFPMINVYGGKMGKLVQIEQPYKDEAHHVNIR